MTPEEIRNMPAGREMDAAVAEYVMGCKVHIITGSNGSVIGRACRCAPNYPHMHSPLVYDWVKEYSTDIAAAWTVVENLQRHEFKLRLIWTVGEPPNYSGGFGDNDWGSGETAPLAICRAALLAAGQGPQESIHVE